LNKKDLTKVIRKEYDLSCREADSLIDLVFESMKDELQKRERVNIRNFGSFKVRKYKAKVIKEIKYGTLSTIEAREKVKFKPSKNILKT